MNIIKFLNEDRILRFLEETGDKNEIHKSPISMVPGMYWVKIAESLLNSFESIEKRRLESLKVSFKGRLKYTTAALDPHVYITQNEGDEGIFVFNFKNGERDRSTVTARYGKRTSQVELLEPEFLKDNRTENAERFKLLYRLPEELQRIGGINGMYIGQSLEFYRLARNAKSLDIGELKPLDEEPRIEELDTYYVDEHKNIIAKGVAKVIPKRKQAA